MKYSGPISNSAQNNFVTSTLYGYQLKLIFLISAFCKGAYITDVHDKHWFLELDFSLL